MNPFTGGTTAETWTKAKFEYGGKNIHKDVNIKPFLNHSYTGHFQDDKGWMFRFDTTNLADVEMTWRWATDKTNGDDRMRAGYTLGSTEIGDTGLTMEEELGSSPETYDFYAHFSGVGPAQSWFLNSWTNFDLANDGQSDDEWRLRTDPLPSNEIIYVAFWLDNGNGTEGYIDNVRITGAAIASPLPAAAWMGMAVLGTMGFVANGPAQAGMNG